MDARTLCVGIITKPFGIKGQVKIHPYTQSPDFFLKHCDFSLADGRNIQLIRSKIEPCGEVISWVSGVTDRTTAETLRGQELFVPRGALAPLATDEYYYDDLVNLTVTDDKGTVLGRVDAVYNFGAGTFLEIKRTNGNVGTIPYNSKSIIDINIKNGTIVIDNNFLLV